MNSGEGSRPAGPTTVASSAISIPFLEVSDLAEPGEVRQLFGPSSSESDDDGDSATNLQQQDGAGVATSALPTPFAEANDTAEQGAVHHLLGAESPQPGLSGTGFSYRHNWGPRRGPWTLRLNLAGVTSRSRVLVSIGEGAAGGPNAGKFIGAARYTLHNVAPRAGGVDIWVNIEWGSNILLYADYLVVNP